MREYVRKPGTALKVKHLRLISSLAEDTSITPRLLDAMQGLVLDLTDLTADEFEDMSMAEVMDVIKGVKEGVASAQAAAVPPATSSG